MKKLLALILAILMTLSLCACGSARNAAPMATSSPAAGAAESYYAADYETPMAATEEAAYEYDGDYGFSAAAKTGSGSEANSSDVPEVDPEKIIYSSDVTVETTEFEDTIAKVEALVKAYGGWIESSSVNGANYYDSSRGYTRNRSASYSLRIPSNRFSELMGNLSDLGNIPYSHTYTENVTAQYYDVQARLTAYEAQETRLLEMMEKAETVSDVIVIEDRLTDLRYQIERLQSSLNSWDRQVSYSTVDLELQEVAVYTPEADPSYGQELWMALTGGLHNAGQFFKDLLLVLVSLLPLLVILGVLALIFVPRIKKRRAAKQAEREAFRAAIRPQTPPEAENKE